MTQNVIRGDQKQSEFRENGDVSSIRLDPAAERLPLSLPAVHKSMNYRRAMHDFNFNLSQTQCHPDGNDNTEMDTTQHIHFAQQTQQFPSQIATDQNPNHHHNRSTAEEKNRTAISVRTNPGIPDGILINDKDDHDLLKPMAIEKWLNLAKHGIEDCVNYKFAVCRELVKVLIYEGLGNEEPVKGWIKKFCSGLNDENFGYLMNGLFSANRKWLIEHGYMDQQEKKLKPFTFRANNLDGIDLNMNMAPEVSSKGDPANAPDAKMMRRLISSISPIADLSNPIKHTPMKPTPTTISPVTPTVSSMVSIPKSETSSFVSGVLRKKQSSFSSPIPMKRKRVNPGPTTTNHNCLLLNGNPMKKRRINDDSSVYYQWFMRKESQSEHESKVKERKTLRKLNKQKMNIVSKSSFNEDDDDSSDDGLNIPIGCNFYHE